jgi:hypothetical protein
VAIRTELHVPRRRSRHDDDGPPSVMFLVGMAMALVGAHAIVWALALLE